SKESGDGHGWYSRSARLAIHAPGPSSSEGSSGSPARDAWGFAISSVICRSLRIAWLGATLTGCAGTFTRVPLPTVTSGEERAVGAAAGVLTLEQAERFMHENFYRILYDEEPHSSGESRDEFGTR